MPHIAPLSDTKSKKILSRWFWDVLVHHDAPSGVLTAAPWMHKDRDAVANSNRSTPKFDVF